MATELEIWLADRTVTVKAGAALQPTAARPLPASALEVPADEVARLIGEALQELSIGSPIVTLVLPSSWCYVHRLSVPQRRPSPAVLAYALEEYLPLEIERCTCDFIRTGKGQYLGVAVATDRVRPLLDLLAAQGLQVEHVRIDVLQAAHRAPGAKLLLWCDDEHVAALRQSEQGLEELRIIRLAAGLAEEEWCRRIGLHLGAVEEPDRAVLGCASPQRLARLEVSLAAQHPVADDAPASESSPLRRSVASPLPSVPPSLRPPVPSSLRPSVPSSLLPFDLARDALAPGNHQGSLLRCWRRVAAVTLAGLLALCAGLYVYQVRLDARLKAVTTWEGQVFAGLFPGEPVPAGVALRLASERRRLEALTGPGSAAPQDETDALELLRAVVAALPADVRVDLQELRIEGRDVTLRGSLRDHQQAEQLAAALGQVPGLECAAPRTQRLPAGGVQFFLHAQRKEPSPSTGNASVRHVARELMLAINGNRLAREQTTALEVCP